MAKKRSSRRPVPPAPPVEEAEVEVVEEEELRDEIDTHLLERDTIRFEGDSEEDEDEELETEDVLQLPDSEDEYEEDEELGSGEEEIQERDLEEIEDELRVTDKAWGRRKVSYYQEEEEEEEGSGEEEELEEEEEREAMVLQKRLLSKLTDKDFSTDRFVADPSDVDKREMVVKTDITTMSKDEKLIYLLQNSPELPEMLEEFREKLSEAKEPLYPLLELGRKKGTFSNTGHSYIEAKYKLNLLYTLNIGFYLMLQSTTANKAEIKNHPVIQRIVNLRGIFKTCDKTDFTLEKEIENLLQVNETKKRKVSDNDPESFSCEDEQEEDDLYEQRKKLSEEKKRKKKKKKKGLEISSEDHTIMKEDEEKRGITYKIMKNKGLTPHRKKEQRNPRVKHRKKFDKALKKRRSQVPDFRSQDGAYGGEKGGIKSGLTKSTKLK